MLFFREEAIKTSGVFIIKDLILVCRSLEAKEERKSEERALLL